MPGIAGVITSQLPADACRRLVDQMVASMKHETSYVSGTCAAPEIGVFAGWAALESSLPQCQPTPDEPRGVALLLAGECFLDSDQRVPIHGTLTDLPEDDAFYANLNGLFSGFLIDRHQRKAILFNDRYGMERIYYHQGREAFFFASEAKALLRVLPELRAFDETGLVEFLYYGCTLGWKSLFRQIGILPGASLWTFTPNGKCNTRNYFAPTAWESQEALLDGAFALDLGRTFSRILPRYFESDHAIGVSLTGGLDSRMIMSCRPPTRHTPVSYTFAGPARDTLDVRLAAQVARACHVPHHVLQIGQDFFSTFASLVDRTVYLTDGYLGVCGAHEIYLNRHARSLSPVRLTGNFGGEILRSATTFKPRSMSADFLSPDLRLPGDRRESTRNTMHPVSFAAFREIPWHLFGVVRAAQSQLTTRTPYLDNEIVALAFRAPERLRRSSAPALRVIRDTHAGLARIRTDSGLLPSSRVSSLLGSLWYRSTFKLDYWRNVGFPSPLSPLDIFLSRVPSGRSLLPGHRFLHYRRWFQSELADYLRERLRDPHVLRSPLWNRSFLEHAIEGHISGRSNYFREIDAVLTCSAIERLLLGRDL